jgi:hypothetical protein
MAFKTVIYGDSGVGKTVCVATLLLAGQKVRFLGAENNAIPGIKKGVEIWKAGAHVENLAIMIPDRPKRNSAALLRSMENFLKVPLETQMKQADPNRKDYTRYLSVLKGLTDFKDEAGASLGAVDSWDESTTFVIDGLTIICEAIRQAVIGGKLTTSQPEWGVMQAQLMDLIRMLTEDTRCNIVLLAHPTKEIDPILGVQRIYPANLGQALNPIIPTAFTDVIWAERKGTDFSWNTDHKTAVCRTTHLPIKDKLPQDFRQFFPKAA